jgi:hypothetical protein
VLCDHFILSGITGSKVEGNRVSLYNPLGPVRSLDRCRHDIPHPLSDRDRCGLRLWRMDVLAEETHYTDCQLMEFKRAAHSERCTSQVVTQSRSASES